MQEFCEFFNLFRIRSGFSTLGSFGKALADEGYIYEDSIFSKWKSGERVPRDRELVLALVRVFVRSGGIRTPDDANQLLSSLDYRHLDIYEMRIFGKENESAQGIYSQYKPLVEPNVLFQHVPVTLDNTRFVHLQSIWKTQERVYWNYQVRCAIADYYSKLSKGEMSASEIFRTFSIDKYDTAGNTQIVVSITSDSITQREYLTGVLRLTQGDKDLVSPVEVFEYYGCRDRWLHGALCLRVDELGDLSRLVIPDWASSEASMILRNMQSVVEQIGIERGVKLLYVSMSPMLTNFIEKTGLQVKRVENAFLYHREPNAEYKYPEAYKKAKEFSLYWYDMNPALYVFSEYGVMKA